MAVKNQENEAEIRKHLSVCHYICVWWSAVGWQEHVWHQRVWLEVCAQMPAGVCQTIAEGTTVVWDGVEIAQMHVSHLHTISVDVIGMLEG